MDRKVSRPSPVPHKRLNRLAHLGRLAGGVAGGILTEGIRQVASGKIPRASDLVLSPANVQRVADKLAELRGAAMKVGQLLSMDAGDLLPAELSSILSRLRADARPMPVSQVVQVLESAYGPGWEKAFHRFSYTPMAAASIGQVHAAITRDQRHLALKIQYPGIRQSIDSDVDNVATVLRISNLLPKDLAIEQLLQEAKRQLHEETDYLCESAHLQRFSELLESTPDFLVPDVDNDITCENILAMEHIEGVPIESLDTASQATRDRVVSLLIGLLFRELFDFRLIQTDPNFANFLYNIQTRQLGLLDFGATRRFSTTVSEGYRSLLRAALNQDKATMAESAQIIGYFQENIHSPQLASVMEMFILATEPARTHGYFDFGSTDLAIRIRKAAMKLSLEQGYWHTPPADALFLHRKIGGLYLLAARLRAKVNVRAILEPHLIRIVDSKTAG